MAYYIKVPGAEYFSKPCETIESARVYAANHYEKMKVKNIVINGYRITGGVPIYRSTSNSKPVGYVVGADNWYYVTPKGKTEIQSKRILANGKLSRRN